jgi:sporulation protein YlmC with PRC-barrel domain
MDLPMNVTIECIDGPYGHSVAIMLNPSSNEVTHLIVREPSLMGIDRMVSVDLVTESTPELIRLRCTKDELAELPPFVSTSYLPASPSYMPGYGAGMMFSPYLSMQPGISIDHENTPADELALHRGAHVQATDGHIGEVEEFLVNPVSHRITHVVLREGHFWSRQNVTIPVIDIDRIEDDTVYLTLNKHEIEALPALALHRHVR